MWSDRAKGLFNAEESQPNVKKVDRLLWRFFATFFKPFFKQPRQQHFFTLVPLINMQTLSVTLNFWTWRWMNTHLSHLITIFCSHRLFRFGNVIDILVQIKFFTCLRRRYHTKRCHYSIRIFLSNFGNKQSAHACPSTTPKGMCQLEALYAVAPLGLPAHHI